MKSRIPKIAISLVLATPVSYGTARVIRSADLSEVAKAVTFYADIPSRLQDAVTSFKMLPERMNPTRSECN